MKTRVLLMGLIATVSVTLNTGCWNNPCWGWRLHPCAYCHSAAPAVGPAPVAYRIPSAPVGSPIGGDCASCGCGGGAIQQPIYGGPVPNVFPEGAYPPVIGNPMPLPGMTSAPGRDFVPSPMPTVMSGKN